MFRPIALMANRSAQNFWTLFWVLICLHQLYFGWFLIKSNFVPYVMDGNETFSVWWHSHNLYTFSFWKSFGLTDESYGLTEASHPFFHTHQGNMPRLFGFLIYALGARTVEAQVLVTTLIIGNLTLFFCYASIAKLTRPAIAFVFCLFLFSDYLLYAQWHVVTYRVWYGFLFFGTLFAILSAARPNAVWPYLLSGLLFFLLFYGELVFAFYVSAVCGIFALWRYWRNPKKIAAIYLAQSVGGLAALALLFFQLKAALGLDVIVKDFGATFMARNASMGNTVGSSLVDFFHGNNIVFWLNFRDGASLRTLAAFTRSITTSVFQVWTPAFLIMVAAPFVGIAIAFIERDSKQSRAGLSGSDAIEPSQRDQEDPSSGFSISTVAGPNKNRWSCSVEWGQMRNMLALKSPTGLRFANGLALFLGIGLVVLSVFQPGRPFGVSPYDSISEWATVLVAAALSVSLLGLFAIHSGKDAALLAAWRTMSKYTPAAILVASALVMFQVSLPGVSNPSSKLVAIAIAMSGIGLLLGYFLPAPSLLTICRGTLTCSLVTFLIVRSPALFDQDYSAIWLSPVQDLRIRFLIRLAMLLMMGGGVAIAVCGANKSFGSTWKAAFRHALAFFFVGIGSYAIVYILSPGYVLSGYAERSAPFAIFFLSSIPAIAICGTVVAGRRYAANLLSNAGDRGSQFRGRVVVPLCLTFTVAVVVLFWIKVQAYYAQLFPPNHAEFAKTLSLPPFAGSSFAVNNYAAVVAYYTRNWAYIDELLANPSIDPLDGEAGRLTEPTYRWFADWKSNPEYRHPKYYACMKMPTFNSVLASRDPKRFGDRLAFCSSESALWEKSPFQDRLVAADATPARFWSIILLGEARPKIDDVSTLVQSRDGKWVIENKVAVRYDHDHPATSKTIELLVGSRASCDGAETNWRVAQTAADDAVFSLPTDFAGRFRLRAIVRSSVGDSGPRFGDMWIVKTGSEANHQELSRCPSVLADGPFASSGLSDPAAGWGGPESWGAWTVGRHASLRAMPVSSAAANSDFVLDANVRAFVPGQGRRLNVDVLANGTKVANWAFSELDSKRAVTVRIPKSVMAGRSALSLSFDISDPVSPASLRISADRRDLGIGLEWLAIKEVEQ